MSTRSLLLLVGLVGGAELFARGYLANHLLAFQAGAWMLAVSLLVATRRRGAWLRRGALALGLVLVALACAEWLPRPATPAPAPAPLASTSFAQSGGDPAALTLWWQMHERERRVLDGQTELAPGQRFSWFGSEVALDDHGQRAMPPGADGAFRIVVLGGSASFGTELTPEEPTWPSALAAELDARYVCRRPLSVSNAARPDRTLRSLGRRFELEIASQAPDLLVVYPGVDALGELGPPAEQVPAATRPERASRWLAALERPLRERAEARALRAALAVETPAEGLRRSATARDYRTLLVAARTAGVDVALVPLALAVDARSPEPVIRFYEGASPDARRLLVANQDHTRLLPLIGAAYRAQVIAPGDDLDGAWQDAFLDLVHLSATGSRRLAEHVARGLEPLLTRPDPGCAPRAAAS